MGAAAIAASPAPSEAAYGETAKIFGSVTNASGELLGCWRHKPLHVFCKDAVIFPWNLAEAKWLHAVGCSSESFRCVAQMNLEATKTW